LCGCGTTTGYGTTGYGITSDHGIILTLSHGTRIILISIEAKKLNVIRLKMTFRL